MSLVVIRQAWLDMESKRQMRPYHALNLSCKICASELHPRVHEKLCKLGGDVVG